MIGVLVAPTALAYDWPQFGGDAAHSGLNNSETRISSSNVASLAQQYVVTLPGTVDGAPVFLDNSSLALGGKDLLFFTTRDGRILAYDRFGAQVWAKQFGPGSCKINNGGTTCYTTSSPAIDPNRQYVYTYGLDGFVHKLQVADGVEIIGGGWPQLATAKPYDEKGSSALAIASSGATSWLYVVHSGYPGDNGDYQGHVTAIDLTTGAQNVFNAACSNIAQHLQHLGGGGSPTCSTPQNGIWARAGVIYHPGTDRIFLSTGNGAYNGNSGGFNWSESIIALHPDGTGGSASDAGKPLDAYTPTNFQSLDNADADIGSTAPAILPASASTVPHLAVQGGKDGQLRLLNLANLSGQGGPGHVGGEIGPIIDVPQGGGVFSQPAVWINPADDSTWVFIVNGNGASALRVALGSSKIPMLVPQWQNSLSGTSPIVANNVLFFIAGSSLRALNPVTGATLWSVARGGGTHWQSLIIANSALYATDASNNLVAFGLTMEQPTPAPTATTITTLASSSNPVPNGALLTLTATVSGSTPTGTVAFLNGDAPVDGCSTVALSSAAAVCNVSTLRVGLHRLVATYSGDNSNAGSTSAVLLQSVDASAEFFNGAISAGTANVRIQPR